MEQQETQAAPEETYKLCAELPKSLMRRFQIVVISKYGNRKMKHVMTDLVTKFVEREEKSLRKEGNS